VHFDAIYFCFIHGLYFFVIWTEWINWTEQVDLAQPKVEQSKLARTSTQVARLEEETAEDVIKELTIEVTAGEEIQVMIMCDIMCFIMV